MYVLNKKKWVLKTSSEGFYNRTPSNSQGILKFIYTLQKEKERNCRVHVLISRQNRNNKENRSITGFHYENICENPHLE